MWIASRACHPVLPGDANREHSKLFEVVSVGQDLDHRPGRTEL